ncbi:hypothetical protein CORC01_02205 [Colletotrichum orchidophilum]|uniref:Rhodopsin domain-containing protein n=1 Tax=Colletotrichum orchidophilum TaxID=1209926 RepID=A0A1G4BM19_9PEZI|nr:uncharacterized protein CORC01_02205 [Colletotrichum orchidophilum]OHF02510.1 hypothetical protein CORC01_02205 [Colletotrichum orchidophilum]
MAAGNESFAASLQRQSWIHYSIGMTFILLRMYGRAKRLGGVSHFQVDDYLQILAAILFTILVALLNVITEGGGSNLYPPELAGTFTPDEIQDRITGSKIVLVSEQAMLNLIYVLKACVLILYTRLTLNLAAQRLVRWLAMYVAVGWTATQITMFTACRPFSGYWAMPPPDPQCTTYQHYAILQGWFNISSDTLMLMIPLPLVFRMKVPRKQKVVLLFVFSLGVCVIVAALLTKIFNLSDPYSPNYMLWYIREASVAVYVSNLPLLWPLLREWFPWLRNLKTAGMLPTPYRQTTNPRTKQDANLSSGVTVQSGHRAAPAGVPVSSRHSFDEFGTWLGANDLELQKPPRALRSTASRRYILEHEDDEPESSAVREEKNEKRMSSIAEYSVGDGGSSMGSSPAPQLSPLDVDQGRFDWEYQRRSRIRSGATGFTVGHYQLAWEDRDRSHDKADGTSASST